MTCCGRCDHEAAGRDDPPTPGEDIARAYWEAERRIDPKLPRWEGLAADLRRFRTATYDLMLADGWTFTPPVR